MNSHVKSVLYMNIHAKRCVILPHCSLLQDYYILASMGMNCAIGVWHAIVTKWLVLVDDDDDDVIKYKNQKYKNAQEVTDIDRYVLLAFGSIYILAHIALILLAYRIVRLFTLC